jgi:glyoxylase-like metal-dependent hydrolase (beta-lactamase superfamily II)
MRTLVEAFLHDDSHTWTYLIADAERGEAAIIDPVLDYDAASARIATTSVEKVLARVRERGWTISWILETHAHADHLSAGDWLRPHLRCTARNRCRHHRRATALCCAVRHRRRTCLRRLAIRPALG